MSSTHTPPPFLLDARDRVVAALERSPTDLPAPDRLRSELDRVTRLVGTAAAGAALPAEPDEADLLGLRLLEVLRGELFRHWPDAGHPVGAAAGGDASPGDDASPNPGALAGPCHDSDRSLLTMVRAFEDVRCHLTPGSDHLLGGPVLDPWARDLLGEVAHTLGSTFGSMVFLTEILSSGVSGEVSAVQREQLHILFRASLTIGSTAGDILRLTRPLRPWSNGDGDEFCVAELMDEVAAAVGPVLAEKSLDLELRAPPSSRRHGSALQLKRVLLGLSLPVLRGMEGGTLRLEAWEGDEDELRFVVGSEGGTPSGPKPFPGGAFRPDQNGTRWSFSMEGLSVSSARRLLEALGGRMTCQEQNGDGFRFGFSLTMPRAPDHAVP